MVRCKVAISLHDISLLQLAQTKEEYESLLKLKQNNWVEVEVKKVAPTKVLKPKVVNKIANEKMAAKNMGSFSF